MHTNTTKFNEKLSKSWPPFPGYVRAFYVLFGKVHQSDEKCSNRNTQCHDQVTEQTVAIVGIL